MSLYPVLWAAEHAPIYDAEERAILIALVLKGDFDGCNCFRSYDTLARVARVDRKTAGRKCRAMETRGILRRQTTHLSKAYLRIPDEQRPVAWEVMIPATWWSAAQLEEINEQRAGLGRPPLTPASRPPLADAPPKKTRSDKGVKRPRPEKQSDRPGTTSPQATQGLQVPTPGTTSPHPPDFKSPPQGLQVPQPSESPSESPPETDPAPSARGAGGVRSTSSSGSGARDVDSGSAAPDRTGSASGEAEKTAVPAQRTAEPEHLPREQAAAVRAVEALLPPLLTARLPYGHIPGRNRPAVLEALESRTVDQLRDRITRRWTAYGYEPAIHDGELRNPVGAALALIAPTPGCPDPACEDGALIDTGEDCRPCIERKAQHRADRLARKAPANRKEPATAKGTCLDCDRPFPGTTPEDGLCTPCRQAPADAVAALAARLEREAAARLEAETLQREAQRRRALRATEAETSDGADTGPGQPELEHPDSEAPGEQGRQATQGEPAAPVSGMPRPDRRVPAPTPQQSPEDDARLRAELLAAHPWMADYIQGSPTE